MTNVQHFPRLEDPQQQERPDFIDWATQMFAKEFQGLIIRDYEGPV